MLKGSIIPSEGYSHRRLYRVIVTYSAMQQKQNIAIVFDGLLMVSGLLLCVLSPYPYQSGFGLILFALGGQGALRR